VEVVEQPFAGGADVDFAVRGRGQAIVRILEDPACLVQPDQQARPAARRLGDDPLGARERPRTVAQVFGAEQLAPDRAGEQLVRRGRRPGEEA
jgi:hypothetical protein